MPSCADLIFVALLGLFSFTALSSRLLADASIGWHIRTGQVILVTHTIPHADLFSSTMAGQPWFAWEWLYDVVAGALANAAGLNGVVVLTALIAAFTFAWTFFLVLRRGTNFMIALILVLLAISAGMIHFLARPHMVSWLFTVLWFCLLEPRVGNGVECAANRKGAGQLWLLPPIMVLWVNLHGGFLVGFVLLGIHWVDAIWVQATWVKAIWTGATERGQAERSFQEAYAGRRAWHLAMIGAASAMATLINPYGWRLHVHIYRYLTNRFLMDRIDEFQSPNFHGAAQKCFAALLMLALVAFAERQSDSQPERPSQILIVLFAVCSGLYAARNIPVSSLLLILIIGPILSRAASSFAEQFSRRGHSPGPSVQAPASFLHRMRQVELTRRGHLWPMAALAFTVWIALHAGFLGSSRWMDARFDAARFPVAAVDYLETHDIRGPVLAPDNWGGYLIYRLYPAKRVVVDDRHDFYGEAFLRSYLTLIHAQPGWRGFLEWNSVGCILAPKDAPLASLLAEDPGWQIVYQDKVANLFVPATASSK